MLCRNGYQILLENSTDIKRELTVRPLTNESVGIPAPAFKVFRVVPKPSALLVPRYYGLSKFGPPTKDVRADYARAPHLTFVGRLRDATRQPEAFAAGIKAFEEYGGGVLSLDAGFGKTTVSLALSAHLKVRTLIVVHKEFLANQWRDRIQEFCPGATIGRIQQGTLDTDKDFVIAMIQTLCSRGEDMIPPKIFDQFGLLIVDEAHHIGASAFSQAMFRFCPKYTLGLTATPERKDGLTRILYWFLGPEFFRVQRTGQKTTRVECVQFKSEMYKEAPPVTRFGKINMAEMINIVTDIPERNTVICGLVREALKGTRRVLILSDRRTHCHYFHQEFGTELSGLYYGGLGEAELAESSKKRVVIGTFSMAQEGLDIPVLDTVILASPKSDIVQAIGRIMRETPGKQNDPLIYDIVDHWSVFHAMARKRANVYRAAGFEFASKSEGLVLPDPVDTKVFGKGKCMFNV
jgi:superfamily II DNA or RNA helicase